MVLRNNYNYFLKIKTYLLQITRDANYVHLIDLQNLLPNIH